MHTKNLNKFVLRPNQKLKDALKVANMIGIAFIADNSGKLLGVITDGDIRRSAIKGYSMDTVVSRVMNRDYFYAIEGTKDSEIFAMLPRQVYCIPVVNQDGIIVGYKFSSELAKKNVLVTGVTGQDGAYMAEFLLSKGYHVFGAYRRTSDLNFSRLEYLNILDKIKLIPLDVTDMGSIYNAFQVSAPVEVYNLAAQSFVHTSFNQPQLTININTIGTCNMLEVIRYYSPAAKFYQASTSELYGKVVEAPQNEKTPFYPRSPYAISKLAAYWQTVNFREAYGIFACNGILFNHESPIRGTEFVTRKITQGVAKIKKGFEKELRLGNLEAKRDWGYARDYVECMWLMLQQEEADDYVVATGKSHSVREFAQKAFQVVGLEYKDYVKVDETYYRPSDVDFLIGDPTKAVERLGWNPNKTSLDELIHMMVVNDLRLVQEN